MITRQWMIRFFAGIALLSMLAGCGSANAGTRNPAAAPASTPTPAPTLMATINSNAAKSNKTAKADEMELLFVPAGTFPMGGAEIDEKAGEDEKPAHTVYTDAFWIDRTEVTVRQYTLCVKAGACKEPLAISAGDLKNYFYETAYANFPVLISAGTMPRPTAIGPGGACPLKPSGKRQHAATTAGFIRGATRPLTSLWPISTGWCGIRWR